MKTIPLMAALALAAVLAVPAQGQGFVNLDFQSPQNLPGDGLVAITNALPGWTVFYGTHQQSQIYYNYPPVGTTSRVFLEGTNFANLTLNGNFSVALTSSGLSITQTGSVPVLAESLLFDMSGVPSQLNGTLSVSLGGQNLSYFAISNPSITRCMLWMFPPLPVRQKP